VNFQTFNWETAQDDIYNNKTRYAKLRSNLTSYLTPPSQADNGKKGSRQYHIRNPANLNYFEKALMRVDSEGKSYIRRIQMCYALLILCHVVNKDLSKLSREDVDEASAFARTRLKPTDHAKWVREIKYIARIVVPEKDNKGRIDDQIVPYAFRHLKSKVDRSTERKKETVSPDEAMGIIQWFRQDLRLQALLALAYESLARPQEILYLRNQDVKLFDNYSLISVSEHGKEGTKELLCTAKVSFPFVAKWYNEHPLRDKPDAFFFCNLGDTNKHGQMSPENVNKHIRDACKSLGINKRVSLYTFKRSGVSHRLMAGESANLIRHTAGWSDIRRLKDYDHTEQKDTYLLELYNQGLVTDDKLPTHLKGYQRKNKKCLFCNHNNSVAEIMCTQCQRPLDRTAILAEEKKKDDRLIELEQQMTEIRAVLAKIASGQAALSQDTVDNRMIVSRPRRN